jgi:DnaK suppressor protein
MRPSFICLLQIPRKPKEYSVTAFPRTLGHDEQTINGHLSRLRAALQEQRRLRRGQLLELSRDADHLAAMDVGDPSGEVTHALRVVATTALAQIEDAIARMDSGTYGACGSCMADIPLERLEILPMAALCLSCAHSDQQRTR